MITSEVAYARSGLVGNPSDIFNGKTMAFLFDRFKAEVILYESPQLHIKPNSRDITLFGSIEELVDYRKQYGYYGGIRIIEAMIVRLKEYCDEIGISLENKNFTLEYRSDIPFGVGLGGSSTIIKAVLSALMRFFGLTEKEIPKPVQPKLILEAETKELDISAGPRIESWLFTGVSCTWTLRLKRTRPIAVCMATTSISILLFFPPLCCLQGDPLQILR